MIEIPCDIWRHILSFNLLPICRRVSRLLRDVEEDLYAQRSSSIPRLRKIVRDRDHECLLFLYNDASFNLLNECISIPKEQIHLIFQYEDTMFSRTMYMIIRDTILNDKIEESFNLIRLKWIYRDLLPLLPSLCISKGSMYKMIDFLVEGGYVSPIPICTCAILTNNITMLKYTMKEYDIDRKNIRHIYNHRKEYVSKPIKTYMTKTCICM
jgi:hypothetical protein